jgi:UDP-glucose 4-epimerase
VKLLVTGGAGTRPSSCPPATGFRADLGWKPEKPDLEAMISDAWNWMQARPNGYE